MNDHEKARLVNELTALAKEFAGAQQLRERIAHCVLPFVECALMGEREACAKLVETDQIGMAATLYDWTKSVGQDLAAKIRMRSNN